MINSLQLVSGSGWTYAWIWGHLQAHKHGLLQSQTSSGSKYGGGITVSISYLPRWSVKTRTRKSLRCDLAPLSPRIILGSWFGWYTFSFGWFDKK